MKTLSEVFTIENLLQAHRKCRRCKQRKREVILFELDLYKNLKKLRESILKHNYNIKHYRVFYVFEPKKRKIESLPYKHRVVQRCLCDYFLRDALEPLLIHDNAACRKNKGTDFARGRLKKFLRSHYNAFGTKGYVLKCDISKFFPTINHEKLKQLLKTIFPPDFYWLVSEFIEVDNRTVGLPIGNQTSQWFALLMLNSVDHYIKETLLVKRYSRYMDDLLFIHSSKDFLNLCLYKLRQKIEQAGLSFNSKTKISKITEGISYLGFHFKLLENGVVSMKVLPGSAKRIRHGGAKMYMRYAYGLDNAMLAVRNIYSYKTYLKRCKNKNFYKTFHI